MKSWQKVWLYIVFFFSIIHLIRDVLQDSGYKTFISTALTKPHPNFSPSWFKYNTYPIEILLILLAFLLIKKNRFGLYGYMTMIISFLVIGCWAIYWFYL